MYPLEYGSKNALVNCVIHAGNDVKKLLNSFKPDAFTNSNQCVKGIKYVTGVSFGLIAPVNYFGKNRVSKNARFLFAFVIDLDYLRENNIRDLLFQIKGN